MISILSKHIHSHDLMCPHNILVMEAEVLLVVSKTQMQISSSGNMAGQVYTTKK